MIADTLHAYPILSLIDGHLKPVNKGVVIVRTFRKLIRLFQEFYNRNDDVVLWFAETIPRETNDRFLKMLQNIRKPNVKQIVPFKVGNAIVCHTGITVMGIIAARNFDLD